MANNDIYIGDSEDDEIDSEVNQIMTRNSNRKQSEIEYRVKKRMDSRLATRERLRAGNVGYEHIDSVGCKRCVRAILTLDHDAACEIGKRLVCILPQSQDLTSSIY